MTVADCQNYLLQKYYPQGLVTMTSTATSTNYAATRGILNTVTDGLLSNYWRPSTTNAQQYIQVPHSVQGYTVVGSVPNE